MEERKTKIEKSIFVRGLKKRIGCLSAQFVIPLSSRNSYFNGGGETITSTHIDYILKTQRLKGHIQGGSCMEEGKIEVRGNKEERNVYMLETVYYIRRRQRVLLRRPSSIWFN